MFDKVNVMKIFFSEIDLLSTCNRGVYSQDGQLCLEFTAEFFTNLALRNLEPCFVEPTLKITGLYCLIQYTKGIALNLAAPCKFKTLMKLLNMVNHSQKKFLTSVIKTVIHS